MAQPYPREAGGPLQFIQRHTNGDGQGQGGQEVCDRIGPLEPKQPATGNHGLASHVEIDLKPMRRRRGIQRPKFAIDVQSCRERQRFGKFEELYEWIEEKPPEWMDAICPIFPDIQNMLSRTQFAGSNGLFQSRFSVSSGFNPLTSFSFQLVVALGLAVSGCSQKSETETKITAPSEASQYAPKAQPLPASLPIAGTATPEEVAGQLTLELRRYVSFTRSIPKSFEDFVTNDPIQFPPPPAGKKYVIVDGKVILQ